MRAHVLPLLALLLAAGTACDGFGTGEPDVSIFDVPVDAPTWEEHIAPLMDVHCVECHGEVPTHGAPSSLQLDTYDGTVEAAEASWSRMVDTPSRPMPTLDRPPMNDAELTTFANWIEAGMPRSEATR